MQVQELFIDEMLCMVCGRVRWIIKENMLMNLMVLCFLISYFCYASFFFWAFGFFILILAGAEINIKVVINDFFDKNVLIIKFGECVVN